MSEESSLFEKIVMVASGGVAGVVIKLVWDHYSKRDFLLPTHKLVARYKEEKGLSRWGTWRLRKHLSHTVSEMSEKLRPVKVAEIASELPERYPAIVIRTPGMATLCPQYNPEAPKDGAARVILYLRLDGFEHESSETTKQSAYFRDNVLECIKTALRQNELMFLGLHREGLKPALYLWVDATLLIWSTPEAVDLSLDRLSEGLRKKYPALRPVLEITAAEDVARHLDASYFPGEIESSRHSHSSDSQAAIQYVLTRNHLFELVALGGALWKISERSKTVQLDVPSSILDRRVAEIRKSLLAHWTNLTIFGPAGSGKTQLSRNLVSELCKRRGVIAIEVTIEEVTQNSTRTFVERSEGSPIDALRAVLSARLTERCQETVKTCISRACDDVARLAIRDDEFVVIVLCDDLDSYAELREWLRRLRVDVRARGLTIKTIGVQRSEVEPTETGDGNFRFGTQLFRVDEAKQILAHNGIPSATLEGEQSLVERKSFGGGQEISLYRLRLIREWLKTSETDLASEVLRTTVERIVAPMAAEMEHAVPYDELQKAIKHLRHLGARENVKGREIVQILPKDGEIDVVKVLGDLAWHSKYNYAKQIEAENVVNLSSGQIVTTELASRFLVQGKEAGIFLMGNMQSARWHDQLVADGCAVMRLASYTHEKEGILADMVIKLVKRNASEMLWMAADHGTFRRIVDALTRRSDTVRFLDRVLTDEAINWLSQSRADLQSVSSTLLAVGQNLGGSRERLWVARVLFKLLKHDTDLADLLSQPTMPKVWEMIGILVVAMSQEPEEFERQYKNKASEEERHALLAAAQVWPENERHRLSMWYRHWLGTRGDFWVVRECCEHRATGELLEFVAESVEEIGVDEGANDAYTKSGIHEVLEVLGQREITSAGKQELGKVMGGVLGRLSEETLSRFTNALLVTLGWVPEFVGMVWHLEETRSFVLPVEARDTALSDILSCIAQSRVAVPSSKDLKRCKGIALGGGELVRDALPSDFEETVRKGQGSVQFYAGTAMTWDGAKFSYVADRRKGEELGGNTIVRWRPKVELKELGAT